MAVRGADGAASLVAHSGAWLARLRTVLDAAAERSEDSLAANAPSLSATLGAACRVIAVRADATNGTRATGEEISVALALMQHAALVDLHAESTSPAKTGEATAERALALLLAHAAKRGDAASVVAPVLEFSCGVLGQVDADTDADMGASSSTPAKVVGGSKVLPVAAEKAIEVLARSVAGALAAAQLLAEAATGRTLFVVKPGIAMATLRMLVAAVPVKGKIAVARAVAAVLPNVCTEHGETVGDGAASAEDGETVGDGAASAGTADGDGIIDDLKTLVIGITGSG